MYRRFSFEGDIHATLKFIPLALRRKLDLAAVRISFAAWRALTRAERLALLHVPAETPGDREVFREVLRGFAARAGVPVEPLEDAPRAWSAATIPPQVAARLAELAIPLPEERWSRLDDDERYALFKLARPDREPDKLRAAAAELLGPAP